MLKFWCLSQSRTAELMFSSIFLLCLLVSRKWPQYEPAGRVRMSGRRRAFCLDMEQRAVRINTELTGFKLGK